MDMEGELNFGNGRGGARPIPRFQDLFSGSVDDPSLDSTKWTQKTRTGASVTGGLARTTTGASIGQFVGYIKDQMGTTNNELITITGVKYTGAASRMELYVRDSAKSITDRDAGGHTGAGYMIYLTRGAGGASVQRLSGTSQTLIGSAFELTGIGDGNAHTVTVRVTTLPDRVRFTIAIDGGAETIIDDTNVARIAGPGYIGFCQVSFSSTTDMTEFTVVG